MYAERKIRKALASGFQRCIYKKKFLNERYHRDIDVDKELPGVKKRKIKGKEYLVFEKDELKVLIEDAHKYILVYDVKADEYFPVTKSFSRTIIRKARS